MLKEFIREFEEEEKRR